MKKLFALLTVFLAGMTVCSAQKYALGDYVVIDEVPGFVFYVDESGQHGLIMSMPAYGRGELSLDAANKNFYAKVWAGKDADKKELEKYWKEHASWVCGPFIPYLKKVDKKELALYFKMLDELEELTGPEGEKNCRVIANYCQEKGYDMSRYFPEVVWARNLGEGWYVAGHDELDKFATFYAGGVNKKILGAKWLFIAKDLAGKDNFELRYGLQAYANLGMKSSSICRSKKGQAFFEDLGVAKSQAGPWYFYWAVGPDNSWVKYGTDGNIAAVRKF